MGKLVVSASISESRIRFTIIDAFPRPIRHRIACPFSSPSWYQYDSISVEAFILHNVLVLDAYYKNLAISSPSYFVSKESSIRQTQKQLRKCCKYSTFNKCNIATIDKS